VEGRVVRGRSHAELVQVGLGDYDRTGLLQIEDGGGAVRRLEAGKEARTAAQAPALDGDIVLDREGHARERARKRAGEWIR
jgi:hypothetical protein